MQMYPSGGVGYKEHYYTTVEEADYFLKDDHHYNKGSTIQMIKPDNEFKHNYTKIHDGYGKKNKHGHDGYGANYDHNKHGAGLDYNKHDGSEGFYNGHDHSKHGGRVEGFYGGGGHDHNKHGGGSDGFFSGGHDHNKHGREGYSAKYSETWYGKEKDYDDWNMKNNYSGYGGSHHNGGGYWANQGPHLPAAEHQGYYYSEQAKRPAVWDCKGIDD